MRNYSVFLLLSLLCATGHLRGQTSTLRDTVLVPLPGGQLLDTLTVVPGSVQLYGLRTEDWRIDGRFLQWQTLDLPDSLRITYRILPFALERTARLIDSTQLVREERGLVIGGYDNYVRSGLFDNDTKVRTSGSFSRAISFGNSQDLVLNSAFNLQLEGEIGNGIEVAAAITDESLPVQPEGTTQQLREFDKIFIQLRKNRSVLTAGDYELRNPDGYFLRFFKKLEGATFTTVSGADSGTFGKPGGAAAAGVKKGQKQGNTTNPPASPIPDSRLPTPDSRLTTTASIAVARGQFTRQQITPVEGNQGPYKLTGDGGQRFLVILAGTERILLNGVPLVRGLDADYTIDYNLAEITFTTRRLITRDSRITAEYEYADQRYVRTLATGGTRYDRGRFSAYLNGYTQQDSKTATGDLELTTNQRQQLSQAGDLPGGIPVLSIDTLEGRSEIRATYTLRDTVSCQGRDTFYLVSSTEGNYVAAFTDRGPNGGEYALDPERPANERVYEYVGYDPATCLPRGSFSPVIDLVAPTQQQLIALGGEYRFADRGTVRLEGSRSKLDLNRFSREDGADDGGNALRLDLDRTVGMGPDSLGWSFTGRGHYEFVEETFNAINPYRSPEFFRNWNLSNRLGTAQPERAVERILGAGFGLTKDGVGQLDYDYEQFTRGSQYTGRRHAAALRIRTNGWLLDGAASLLDSDADGVAGSFRRPALRVEKRLDALGGWTLKSAYRGERSLRSVLNSDTLSALSFQFDQYEAGLQAPANDNYRFGITASQRTDKLPRATELVTSTRASEVTAEGSYSAGKNVQLAGNFTFRDLDVAASDLVDDTPNRTFLGRLDLRTTGVNRSLRTQTTYQVGSGQEPRVDFQYLYVGPGQGQYIWQDSLYNNDGRIQPNEMEIAPFPDIADYVRVSVFSNDFIRTNNVALNQKITWDPARLWRTLQQRPEKKESTDNQKVPTEEERKRAKRKEAFRRLVRKVSFNNSFQIDRKTLESEDIQSWNPLQLGVADSALVALNLARRSGLFFNRANPRYDLQLSNNDRRTRRVLTTGYEASRTQDWTLRFRYRPNDQLSLEAAGVAGRREADSEFFNNKDFKIERRSFEPSVTWQPGEFRFLFGSIVANESNVLSPDSGEQTDRLELQFEGNYKNWLTTRLRWIDIDFTGDSRSPVGFALLQGLQPGRNLLWNLGATRQLGKYLQLTISYEGRQTGEAKTIHVGRAQVQAFF